MSLRDVHSRLVRLPALWVEKPLATADVQAQAFEVVPCDPTGGTLTVSLPPTAPGAPPVQVIVKNTTDDTTPIVVAPLAGGSIDGNAAAVIDSPRGILQVISTGEANQYLSVTPAAPVSITNHNDLGNLLWALAQHTGTAGSLAAFDNAGAAAEVTGSGAGDLPLFTGAAWALLALGTPGQVLQVNAGGTAPEYATISTGAAVLSWGNSNIANTTTTRYLLPAYELATAPTSPVVQRAPFSGTIDRLYVQHNNPGGNGNDVVYTLRINGVATALSVALPSNATDGADLLNQVAVAQGDTWDIEVTKAAGTGTGGGLLEVTVTARFR